MREKPVAHCLKAAIAQCLKAGPRPLARRRDSPSVYGHGRVAIEASWLAAATDLAQPWSAPEASSPAATKPPRRGRAEDGRLSTCRRDRATTRRRPPGHDHGLPPPPPSRRARRRDVLALCRAASAVKRSLLVARGPTRRGRSADRGRPPRLGPVRDLHTPARRRGPPATAEARLPVRHDCDPPRPRPRATTTTEASRCRPWQ